MPDRLQLHRIESLPIDTALFRFRVELRLGTATFRVEVDAAELLDFDKFQAAALGQTGRLIMPPCSEGAEGPDHYRRHRRVWLGELERAEWINDDGEADNILPLPISSRHTAGPVRPAIQAPHWIYAHAAAREIQ